MNSKKSYEMPQIFRVELKHEQAILSVCTTPSTSNQAGGGPNCRPNNGCKRANAAGDSAARPS